MRNFSFNSLIGALVTLHIAASNALASGGGGTAMPWESPFETILDSISGPVARVIGVIAITSAGLGIAFGEGGGGMKKMLWVVFGLTIAFTATSFFLSFLGFASGATI